jgi:hypothetical protein
MLNEEKNKQALNGVLVLGLGRSLSQMNLVRSVTIAGEA